MALLFYRSNIQSYFDYCSLVWCNTGKTNMQTLQLLQNRSLRVVLRVGYMYSSQLIYDSLKFDKLDVRFCKHLAHLMFKVVKKELPSYIYMQFITQTFNYSLRVGDVHFSIPRIKTKYGKRCFRYRGSKLWNVIRKSSSVYTLTAQQFKKYIISLDWKHIFTQMYPYWIFLYISCI